jgi:aspartyl-tRNA(Asn)/glutamyl-tRNA(Gln) amidotransferase subunit A
MIPAPPFVDLTEAAEALAARRISARALATMHLDRAAALNPRLNAFVAIEREEALSAADASDARRARGTTLGVLDGVPFGYKDLFYRAGQVCGCGSRIRAEWIPDVTATVVTRLEQAGVVPLGRLHMTEFAAGPTGLNEHLGPCRNPWDTDRIPGGSSSGAGAALASRLVLGALGSDTGGSVRLPAAMCGISALFPTRGRVSRAGVAPLAPSMDTAGPMAASARDLVPLFTTIAGPDPADGWVLADSAARDLPPVSFRGLRVGIATNPWAPGPTPGMQQALEAAWAAMREAGAIIVPIEVPLMPEALALGAAITRAEMAAAHARWFAEDPGAYGRILRFRLGVGMQVPAVQYIDAQSLRGRVAARFTDVFDRVDVLAVPGFGGAAPRIADLEPTEDNVETVWAAIGDWTRPFNYLGVPAVSLPCGFDNGMPVGLQFIGRHFDDERLLALGIRWQEMTDWHRRMPTLRSAASDEAAIQSGLP